MFPTRFGNVSVSFASLLQSILNKLKGKKSKTHDYTDQVCGRDYVFEVVDNQGRGYMTAQRKGVKIGDYILLQQEDKPYQYQVEEIDYYGEPSDMWMALLKKVAI
jgi:MioC protein